ncbi:MAG: small, acid-soluble spore protein, alpha/beta type [Eubacteriales bacterium]
METTKVRKDGTVKACKKKKKKKPLTPIDKFKIEVAKELGLWDKVKQVGWAGLSAAETGQVGGCMTRKLREKNLKNLGEYQAARTKRKGRM